MENKVTAPAIKGLIISLVLIVLAALTSVFKMEQNKALGIVPIVIMVGGLVYACIQYAKQMDGNVTFGNVFGHGFKATALIAGVMGFWVLISLTVLFPDALERGIELQREAMQKQGMSESTIDQNMALGRKLAVPMGTIITVIMYLIIGAIASLIGAGVAKKNPQPTPFQ